MSSTSQLPGVGLGAPTGNASTAGGAVSTNPAPATAAAATAPAPAPGTVLQLGQVGLTQSDLDNLCAGTGIGEGAIRTFLVSARTLDYFKVDQLKYLARVVEAKGLGCRIRNNSRKAEIVAVISRVLFHEPAGQPAAAAAAALPRPAVAPAPAAAAPRPAATGIPPALDPVLLSRLRTALPASHALGFKSTALHIQEISMIQGYQTNANVTYALRFPMPERETPESKIYLYLFSSNTQQGLKAIPQQAWATNRVAVKNAGRLIQLSPVDPTPVHLDVTPPFWSPPGTASFVTLDMPRYFISKGYILLSMTTKVTENMLVEDMYRKGFESRSQPFPELEPGGIDKSMDSLRKKLASTTDKRTMVAQGLGSDDIEETETTVKFSCPLSLSAPKNPAKGKNCPHIECFDAVSFLQMNANSKVALKCAVCNRGLEMADLLIDPFYCHLLETYAGKSDTCVVKADGTHSLPNKGAAVTIEVETVSVPLTQNNGENNGLKRKSMAVVIDLSDGEEDAAPQAKKPKAAPIVIEID